MNMPKNNVYTVSRLNGEVRQLLEGELGRIWLEAEISNFSAPSSGHWYLTLKDNYAQIRSAMFKGKNRSVTFRPANGQQVLVKGSISVYEPRGDYQLIIDSMLPAGDGLLAQQYEALKMKLAAEGLFAADTKRPLPHNIQRIGVITSATGAAIRDVLQVLKRRDPSIEVIIYPAPVQGEHADRAICHAIMQANDRNEVDVLLVTRGGGSLEDLWCFNSEALAHTIYNSALPIVSAVGHEVDTTISDYVADLRAPTPSAAAELLSQDALSKSDKLIMAITRLKQGWQHYRLKQQQRFSMIEHRLHRQDPKRQLQQYEQRFDEMQLRLESAINARLAKLNMSSQGLAHRLAQQSPSNRLRLEQSRLSFLNQKLNKAMQTRLSDANTALTHAAHQLDTVSPLATLSRGYSITLDANERVVQKVADVNAGDRLTTKLIDGEVQSTVL
ncbi:exodeoxyribonuclease VII large subunit [Shewanella psychrotolerans]|uniref:exodeoxyribonuclease VII large subunit n=1 Tax=Shewanella psychrotolerans TaxID=2864206 RepID=UPI001C66005E|nr:exodeoxyribonuclease VII large subunit [Shewanella psychrotolerans]QYK00382.1 exodeoxyribonuclease VII large subunit [Shewanella psychrotolerans]